MLHSRAVNIIRSRRVEPLNLSARLARKSRGKLLTLFGPRPEAIKLAPVIRQLEACGEIVQTVNVTSSQHTDLLHPLFRAFNLRIDRDLRVMRCDQTPSLTCSRVLAALDSVPAEEQPDLILVQGDTTTALAGALAGFNRRIPVAHVEAGLRSGNPDSPYPEEMNRRLITPLATYHFAATPRNRQTLLAEGVARENIFVTGNPVIDSLRVALDRAAPTPVVEELLAATKGFKRVVLTTHRRENFGAVMVQNLRTLRSFVEAHEDVALIFPVHPNPTVRGHHAAAVLSGHPRIHLVEPLDYEDFITLLRRAWLIVSDSGGGAGESSQSGKTAPHSSGKHRAPGGVGCGRRAARRGPARKSAEHAAGSVPSRELGRKGKNHSEPVRRRRQRETYRLDHRRVAGRRAATTANREEADGLR